MTDSLERVKNPPPSAPGPVGCVVLTADVLDIVSVRENIGINI